MGKLRLSYILLFVSNLEAALRFYRDGVGLEAIDASPGFARLRPPGAAPADCVLALHLTAEPGRVSRNVQLHFDVPDVQSAQRAVSARGVSFAGPPRREPWGAVVAAALDPEGNRVEFVQWDRPEA